MTERETRLRQRIDDLLDQRAEAAVTINGLRKKLRRRYVHGRPGHCLWCGTKTQARVCPLHQDLERIERELYR